MIELIRMVGPLNRRIGPDGSLARRQAALAMPILEKLPETDSKHTENSHQREATSDRQPDDGLVSIREFSEGAFHVAA